MARRFILNSSQLAMLAALTLSVFGTPALAQEAELSPASAPDYSLLGIGAASSTPDYGELLGPRISPPRDDSWAGPSEVSTSESDDHSRDGELKSDANFEARFMGAETDSPVSDARSMEESGSPAGDVRSMEESGSPAGDVRFMEESGGPAGSLRFMSGWYGTSER